MSKSAVSEAKTGGGSILSHRHLCFVAMPGHIESQWADGFREDLKMSARLCRRIDDFKFRFMYEA